MDSKRHLARQELPELQSTKSVCQSTCPLSNPMNIKMASSIGISRRVNNMLVCYYNNFFMKIVSACLHDLRVIYLTRFAV